jgi:hypothetical protein
MEYRMIARDGRLVWVHDEVILVNDLEGKNRNSGRASCSISPSAKPTQESMHEKERLLSEAQSIGHIGSGARHPHGILCSIPMK